MEWKTTCSTTAQRWTTHLSPAIIYVEKNKLTLTNPSHVLMVKYLIQTIMLEQIVSWMWERLHQEMWLYPATEPVRIRLIVCDDQTGNFSNTLLWSCRTHWLTGRGCTSISGTLQKAWLYSLNVNTTDCVAMKWCYWTLIHLQATLCNYLQSLPGLCQCSACWIRLRSHQ